MKTNINHKSAGKPKNGLTFIFQILLAIGLLLSVHTISLAQEFPKQDILDLDLEASGREYLKIQKSQAHPFKLEQAILGGSKLDQAIQLGQRNLQWLDYMNQDLPAEQKIHFTKPGDLKGIPIDAPRKYNETSISTDFDTLKKDLPKEMFEVLFNGKDFTKVPPVSIEDYIKWGKKVDSIYQISSRWKLLIPWKDYLVKRKAEDVRGYYFLNKDQNLKENLENWSKLDQEKQDNYKNYLVGMCYNSRGLADSCTLDLDKNIRLNTVYSYYQKFLSNSEELWKSYFEIPEHRSDVIWNSSAPEIMWVPFVTPKDSKITSFLRDNIEDEWRLATWQLRMDFRLNADEKSTPHVEFVPGSTPHVNGIAGNIITMDANAPLDEWDVRWTIRHEYGHVIGFPDCYVEFWEPTDDAIVSYQLDITNMMCSRAGKFLPIHFTELERVYLK